MFRFLTHLRNTATQAMANDVFDIAKAVAYSGMLMLFPAMLVVTTLLARVPEGTNRGALEQILPADSMDLLQSYVLSRSFHSAQVMISAGALSLFAGLGMML